MKNSFSGCHPVVQLMYFLSVMLFTMLVMHPAVIVISFISSACYALYLGRRKQLKVMLCFVLPMALLIALLNPLFNHAGITILSYFPDGNPLTLESLIFGLVSGAMFSTVLLWCICLQHNMSSDRVIYLFGRLTPKLGLLLSMILRFIPKLTAQFRRIRISRHCMGCDLDQGNILIRTKNAVSMISSLLQWILENSVDTADSLKSRGYGLPHRTSCSVFHFCRRDAALLTFILLSGSALLAAGVSRSLEYYYFPAFYTTDNGSLQYITYSVFLLLCYMPLILDRREDRKWNVLRSKL